MVAVFGAVTCLSSIVRLTISTSVSGLDYSFTYNLEVICLFKSHESTGIVAGFALGAFFLVEYSQLAFFPNNCIYRASFLAGTAFDTLVFNNLPKQQFLTA